MFIIQQRGSICRTLLLIVVLEFTSADRSILHQRTCGNSNTRSISYFKADSEELNWNNAWSLCNIRNSTLPVICNQHEQDALTNYLKANYLGSSPVWTSGRKIQFNEWKWVDGQPFISRSVIRKQHELNTHIVLKEDRNYTAEHPSSKAYYLCQYSDSSCNTQDVKSVTNGCVRASDDDRSWYDARNQCLKNGGDLAILSDNDLVTLRRSNRLNTAHAYWIGLRKNAWHWIRQGTVPSDDSGEEVKYNNWLDDSNSLNGECISIDTSNGEWKAVTCAEKKRVVCQASLDETTSSMSSILKRSTPPISSLSSSTITISTALKDCVERDSSSVSYATFIAVVIVALCVIVISNIIVALVVRKYIYRRANASSMSAATGAAHYQDMETTQKQANPHGIYTELQLQPEYEEVSRS